MKIDRQSADCHHQPRCDSAAVLLKNTDFADNADSIYLLIIKGRLKGGDVKQNEMRTLDFTKEKVQVLTLEELEQSYHENHVDGTPVNGIYHFIQLLKFANV